MTSAINVSQVERWASLMGGAALAVLGLSRRSVGGAMLAAGGGALIARGATGYCPAYAAAGVSTAKPSDTRSALRGAHGINVEQTITLNRPPRDVFAFWRNLENLPRFMRHLESVRALDARRSHWVAKAPAGQTVEWDAEIHNELPNELIGWRTLPGADVVSAGSVHFAPAGAAATEVRVRLQYSPPGGKLGAALAMMLGHDPAQTIQEDLRRLKILMESGEISIPAAGYQTASDSRLRDEAWPRDVH